MSQPGYQRSDAEKWMGTAILLSLAAIACGILLKQHSFNPAVLVATNPSLPPLSPTAPGNRAAWLPPELAEFGAPESFTPDSLYDKIDGKAELYLAAGFVRLHCQRFALKDAPDQWFEWFVYDMGTVPHAFSVFTVQRRAEGEPLDLVEYAYRTRNSLHFVCGSSYVEAVASAAAEALMKAMQAMAGRFVAASPSASTRLTQLDLFPAENLVPGSHALLSADAFGFDQFKNVYTAQYRVGDATLLAFVAACPDATAAVQLAEAYRSFLLENGGRWTQSGSGIEIMGAIEIVFSEGTHVAGIHAAPAEAPAEQVSARLRQRLAEHSK